MKLAKWAVAGLIAATVALTGCSTQAGTTAQVVALQKQVTALSAKVNEIEVTKTELTDFDLQERCAAASRRQDRYQVAKDTKGWSIVGFTSNYDKAIGQCFMEVNSSGPSNGFSTTIYEVPQGIVYGMFISAQKPFSPICQEGPRLKLDSCTSIKQFDAFAARYLDTATGAPAPSGTSALPPGWPVSVGR